MAYDEGASQRVREVLRDRLDTREMKMFGGIAFMVRGNMCVGVINADLMVRVGKDAYEDALSQPHARKMDFTKRPMKGYVFVSPDGYADDEDLDAWVQRGLDFVLTLPEK